jgi:hypothetical protein
MPESSSKSSLEERHQAGENLVRTFISRKQKKHWTQSDYKRFAHDYITDEGILEEYTNEDENGFIDLAEKNHINLNEDEDFQREFWHDCGSDFSEYIKTEDKDVRRGALIVDGMVSDKRSDA